MSTKDGGKIIESIKSHARYLKKREGVRPHHVALDRAAVAAGFQNYRHALNSVGETREAHSEQPQTAASARAEGATEPGR